MIHLSQTHIPRLHVPGAPHTNSINAFLSKRAENKVAEKSAFTIHLLPVWKHWCMIWLTLFKRWDLETGHLDQESIVLICHPWLILNSHLNSKNPSNIHLSFNHKRSHSKRSLLQIVGINMEGRKGEIMKNYRQIWEKYSSQGSQTSVLLRSTAGMVEIDFVKCY